MASNHGASPGEETIILEAKISKRQVCCEMTPLILIAILGIFIFIPFLIIIYFAVIEKWRLYLTSQGIYYSSAVGPLCCCITTERFIKLDEIEAIVSYDTTISVVMARQEVSAYL